MKIMQGLDDASKRASNNRNDFLLQDIQMKEPESSKVNLGTSVEQQWHRCHV